MSDEAVPPAEQVRRARACLAEVGYPDAVVEWGVLQSGSGEEGLRIDAPLDVVWRVLVTADPENENDGGCWPCFERNGSTVGCEHDYRTQPWPPAQEQTGEVR